MSGGADPAGAVRPPTLKASQNSKNPAPLHPKFRFASSDSIRFLPSRRLRPAACCVAQDRTAMRKGDQMTFERNDISCRPASGEQASGSRNCEQGSSQIVPCGVKKAVNFIEANLGAPIRIADLCAASSLSPRTLFKQFRDFIGVPPMTYVRRRRLQRVRSELLDGRAGSVTAAALHWGFSHLGRFSGDYVREFGELPSANLRQARSRNQSSGPPQER